MYTAYSVDDDYLILEEMVDMIPWQDYGFELIGKETNPETALKEILRLSPDVVFVDLKMPVMDGNQLIENVRKCGLSPEFVMVSAYDEFESVRSFFKQNGFDYILKPINPNDLHVVLEKLYAQLSDSQPSKGSITENPQFNELLLYVNAHYKERITLSDLSERFGFNRTYICNLFSKYLNTSLSGYMTDIRMKKANEMLKDENLMLKEIAYSLGYKEYYHFYKVFKGYYGYSPNEHRDD